MRISRIGGRTHRFAPTLRNISYLTQRRAVLFFMNELQIIAKINEEIKSKSKNF